MTIDGYKSCRKLSKQVFSTELNIRYINTKYSSMILTAALAEWLACSPFDPYVQGSSRVGGDFIFQKISWSKGHWNVPAIQSTEWSLNGGWNATEIYFSRHQSVDIQPPFSDYSVDWKVRFHPVKWHNILLISRPVLKQCLIRRCTGKRNVTVKAVILVWCKIIAMLLTS